MAIFGEMTKYKQEDKFKYNNNYDSRREYLIRDAIQEAKDSGFVQNCKVTLLNGEEGQLTSFNNTQSMAFDNITDDIPKVCRIYHKKNNAWVFENMSHLDLELLYTYKNYHYG